MVEENAIVRKFQKELNSGTVSLVVLSLMDASTEPLYGYQIAKLLEAQAEGQLPMKQGALYPVLRAMEANGLLRSNVEPSTSAPPRRYYSVTVEGHNMLAIWINVWGNTRDFVERVLSGVAGNGSQDEEREDV
ncbi:MAG: PadR family transcriptional regulator [Acidobacteriota bacterium]|nr:PadR family transcriptional regulator [Acidobacteriota bacterium]